VAIALGAEGGGIWLYLERDKRLVCELARIPEVVAVGDLNADNVNRVVQRAITDGVPILVSRAEVPGETGAGQDISVVCVGFPMDEGVAGALFLYRDASDRQYFSRESVYLCQSLTPFLSLFAARSGSRQVVQQTMRLGALVELAAELANTQDPERIAYLAANRVPTIVSCERAFLAGARGERLRILAITGHDEVHRGSAQVEVLEALATWALRQGKDWYLTEQVVANSTDEELKKRFDAYCDATAMRASLLLLLRRTGAGAGGAGAEGEGVLGVLAVESREPRLYAPADLTVVSLLARLLSATLARARQYAELPAIALLERASKLRRRPGARARAIRWVTVAVAVVLWLIFGRLPFRVSGACEVVPQERGLLVARVAGLVKEVRGRQGAEVEKGEEVIRLDDQQARLSIEQQQKALAVSDQRLRAFKATDPGRAQEEQANYSLIQAQISYFEEQLEQTRILSPVTGVILTRNLEDLAGSHVAEGEALGEVAPLGKLRLEVAVPEDLIGYVTKDQKVSLLLSSFPGETLEGTVDRIGLTSEARGQRNTFVVTCLLTEPGAALRPGMTGWAHLHCGQRSAGFVLFRSAIAYLQLRVFF
jgi:RND family efflux transporter MFP subunit